MSGTEPQSVIHPEGSGDALVDPAAPTTAPVSGYETTGSIIVPAPTPEVKKITPPVSAGRHLSVAPVKRKLDRDRILFWVAVASGVVCVMGVALFTVAMVFWWKP